MQQALALLEFSGPAAGIAAVDRMLKMSPVALLRCGTVHPGRYLALVGGSVAAVEEAHTTGVNVGCDLGALHDEVCLPDPHPQLAAAVEGERRAVTGEALGVVEVASSPGLLGAMDATLKLVPVDLVELRLADDLGGRAMAVVSGTLTDVQAALELLRERHGDAAGWLDATVLPRLDDTLRDVLGEGTSFRQCRRWEPAGAETVEE
jgi:microcompartment protein CcmL/EutN